jgi:phage gpG-like protein
MAIADQPIPFEHFAAHIAAIGVALESASAKDLWAEELQSIVLEGQAENFVQQSDPNGTPWPLRVFHGHPILDRGRSGIPGHPVLYDLGDLFDSIVNKSAENHVETALDRVFATGTNIFYGADHEYGVPERNLPARPFIGIGEPYIERLGDSIADWGWQIILGVN